MPTRVWPYARCCFRWCGDLRDGQWRGCNMRSPIHVAGAAYACPISMQSARFAHKAERTKSGICGRNGRADVHGQNQQPLHDPSLHAFCRKLLDQRHRRRREKSTYSAYHGISPWLIVWRATWSWHTCSGITSTAKGDSALNSETQHRVFQVQMYVIGVVG